MKAPLHRPHNSLSPHGFLPVLALALLAIHSAHAAWITDTSGKRVFVRGIAYAPYHPTELWALSGRTRGTDYHLMRELHANCIITWNKMTYEDIEGWWKEGLYCIPQVTYRPPRLSIFANGYDAPVPIYVNADNLQGMRDTARDFSSALKGNPAVLAVSLGNDYAWSAFSGDLGFAYGGYDDETLQAFRSNLKRRFGTVEAFVRRSGQEIVTFDDALPPKGLNPQPLFGEWQVFMREAFGAFLDKGKEGLRAVGWEAPVTYCQPYGVKWDPASQGSELPGLDIVSGNIFYAQSRDWSLLCTDIDRLIAGARGRPVLITETGAHSLMGERDTAPRKIKQSIACALLHPEIAGVGVYEYCDEWHRSGNPEKQDDTDAREHWGLVTGHRDQKPAFGAAAEMLGFIERNEQRFQQWQSRPEVLLSMQELDWWRVGGLDGSFCERVAAELYRHGVSFRLADSQSLLNLDPAQCPRLILCDSWLFSSPDGSQSVARAVVGYVEAGGEVLYIAQRPWRQLYGDEFIPEELVPPPDGAPVNRDYGSGRITVIPTYNIEDRDLRFILEDYLGDALHTRPVTDLSAPEGRPQVFWRVFQDDEGLWMLAVNAEKDRIQRLKLQLHEGMDRERVDVRGADGARISREDGELYLLDLNAYALVYLGKAPSTLPAPMPSETTTGTPAIPGETPPPTEPAEGTPAPAPTDAAPGATTPPANDPPQPSPPNPGEPRPGTNGAVTGTVIKPVEP